MRYKIAECVTEYEPHYEMLRRKMEPYRTAGEGEPDIRLTLTKQFCEEKQKEQPHLTEAQCEYIFAGSEFYKKFISEGGISGWKSISVLGGQWNRKVDTYKAVAELFRKRKSIDHQ